MKVIKMNGQTNDSEGDAQDVLAGISCLPGFVMAYIDPKEWRVVSFHEDTAPGEVLKRGTGLQRVEILIANGDQK